jgi:hypothetical protein
MAFCMKEKIFKISVQKGTQVPLAVSTGNLKVTLLKNRKDLFWEP